MGKGKKLKTPLWQQIVYLLLVAGGPIVTIYVAAIKHNPSGKYLTYMTMFFLGLVFILIVNNFIVKPWRIKMQAQIGTLELNYRTKVGCPKETKEMWAMLNFKTFLWEALTILFTSFAVYFLITGMVSWIQHIELYLRLMFASVFFGLIFKAFCYLGNPFRKE